MPLAALEPLPRAGARRRTRSRSPYLRTDGDWALDIALEVERQRAARRRHRRTNARGLYWTFPQQLAHATVNGATVRPGDLFASGTISGPTRHVGSLLELTWAAATRSSSPAAAPFLADGDTVVLRGAAGSGLARRGERPHHARRVTGSPPPAGARGC